MKRSERYFREAVYFGFLGLAILIFSGCAAIWGYVFILDRSPILAVTLTIAALVLFIAGYAQVKEAFRLYRVSCFEEHYEFLRSVRPRL